MRQVSVVLVAVVLFLGTVAQGEPGMLAGGMVVRDCPSGAAVTLTAFPAPGTERLFDSSLVREKVKPKPNAPWAKPLRMECTGYQCGCYDQEAECLAGCPPQGQPGWIQCYAACGAASRQCAKCCCEPALC
jgi:hypothetical protein